MADSERQRLLDEFLAEEQRRTKRLAELTSELGSGSAAAQAFFLEEAHRIHTLALESERAGRWSEALGLFDKAERLPRIAKWFESGRIDREQLRALLSAEWPAVEWPREAGVRRLVRLFRHTGYLTDTPEARQITTLTTIYRGSAEHYRRGMSWTLRRARANWFALRSRFLCGDGHLYAAEIAPQHILAHFAGRNEDEVVVEPRALRSLRELRVQR